MSGSDQGGGEALPRLPIGELVTAAEREVKQRERVYPRWVEGQKMTQAKANHELRAMRDIVATLKELEAGSRLL